MPPTKRGRKRPLDWTEDDVAAADAALEAAQRRYDALKARLIRQERSPQRAELARQFREAAEALGRAGGRARGARIMVGQAEEHRARRVARGHAA